MRVLFVAVALIFGFENFSFSMEELPKETKEQRVKKRNVLKGSFKLFFLKPDADPEEEAKPLRKRDRLARLFGIDQTGENITEVILVQNLLAIPIRLPDIEAPSRHRDRLAKFLGIEQKKQEYKDLPQDGLSSLPKDMHLLILYLLPLKDSLKLLKLNKRTRFTLLDTLTEYKLRVEEESLEKLAELSGDPQAFDNYIASYPDFATYQGSHYPFLEKLLEDNSSWLNNKLLFRGWKDCFNTSNNYVYEHPFQCQKYMDNNRAISSGFEFFREGKDRELSVLPLWLAKEFIRKQIIMLCVSGSCISHLPSSFVRELKNLTSINITYSKLLEIPESLSELHELEHLELQHNLISNLPDIFAPLRKLKYVDLSHNLITHFPEIDKHYFVKNEYSHIDFSHNRWDSESWVLLSYIQIELETEKMREKNWEDFKKDVHDLPDNIQLYILRNTIGKFIPVMRLG